MPTRLPDPELDPAFYDGVPAKRLFAWIVDVIAISLVTVVLALLSLGLLFWVFPVAFVGLSFLYRSFSIATWSATPGMRLMNLELRNAQGERLLPVEAMMHTGAFIVASAMVVLQLISMAMMVMTPAHRGLHDMLLGTVAINRPR